MVTAESIEQSIAAGLACEHLAVRGDGHHWEALIVSAAFENLPKVPPAPARLRGARRADARGDPRAVDDHAHARPVGGGAALTGRDAMDKLLIEGGRPLSGRGRASPARRTRRCRSCAPRCSRRSRSCSTNVPQPQRRAHHAELLAQMGVRSTRGAPGDGRRSTPAASTGRSRPTSSSRPCARRSWRWGRCWRAAARRGSRCPAAARSACGRSTSTSRDCRRWAPRSTSSTATSTPGRARLKGARFVLRPRHRHRHREPDDGGDAGRGHDGARERRARAGGRRPRALPDRDGRADRRRGHRPHRHRGRAAAARRDARGHARPHRDGHLPRGGRRDRRRRARRRAARPARSTRCSTSCARPGPRSRRGAGVDPRVARRGPLAGVQPAHRAVSRRSRPTCRRSSWRSRPRADGTSVDHRDDLREPLHARPGAGAPGRGHRGRGQHGDRARASAS